MLNFTLKVGESHGHQSRGQKDPPWMSPSMLSGSIPELLYLPL